MELSAQLGTDDLGMTFDPNIDDLRGQHESEASWQHRRRFLQVHQGNYPIGRLKQLSYCFSNILMYACEYSDSLMEELSALAVDVVIANALEKGDASVKVPKNYLKDKISKKKNALLAEMHYMKKLHNLRKNQIQCQSDELNELKLRGECIGLSLLPELANKDSQQSSYGQTETEKDDQTMRKCSKLSPLRKLSEVSLRNSDLPPLENKLELFSTTHCSEFSPLGKHLELSPLRQSSELSPLEKKSGLPQSSVISPLEQSSELSLLARLKIDANKDIKYKRMEESYALQHNKETKVSHLMGTPHLSGSHRQAEKIKAVQSKDSHGSELGMGKHTSFTSKPEITYGHEHKSVNFGPRTSCLNRGRMICKSSSVGLSPSDGKAHDSSSKDVDCHGQLTGSGAGSGSHVSKGELLKSKDGVGGGRVYHCYRKGTSHLCQPTEQDSHGEKDRDFSRGQVHFKRSEVNNQRDITPSSEALLSGKGKESFTRKGKRLDLSAENNAIEQRETNVDEQLFDQSYVPRKVGITAIKPGQNNDDPSNYKTDMLTKSKNDQIFERFKLKMNSRKESTSRIGKCHKSVTMLRNSEEKESEMPIKQLMTTTNSPREITKELREGSGKIAPRMTNTEQHGEVGVKSVQNKEKAKFPVLDLHKRLIKTQINSWKKVMKAHEGILHHKSENSEAIRLNDEDNFRSQTQHLLGSQLCGGFLTDVQTGNEIPLTGSEVPQTGNEAQAGSKASQAESEIHLTVSEIPETGSKIPQAGSEIPLTGGEVPQTGSKIPQAGSEIPLTGSEVPQAGSEAPQAESEIHLTGSEVLQTGSEILLTGTEVPQSGSEVLSKGSKDICGVGGNESSDNIHGRLLHFISTSKTRCVKERIDQKISNSHRTSGVCPESETLGNRSTSDSTTTTPLKTTVDYVVSRTQVESLNESAQEMFVKSHNEGQKTLHSSVKGLSTTESLHKAQETCLRLQRIKSQNTDKSHRCVVEVDSGKLHNVKTGLGKKSMKNDQEIVSDIKIKAPGKQRVTSAVEIKVTKLEPEPEKDYQSSVSDINKKLQNQKKSQRKSLSLYSDKFARMYGSKSSAMVGSDCKNDSNKSSTKVRKEDHGTDIKPQDNVNMDVKSSHMTKSTDNDYFSSFEGGGFFLVPNTKSQVQKHQSAPATPEVKGYPSHHRVKLSGCAASVVQGEYKSNLTTGKVKSGKLAEERDSRQKRTGFTPDLDCKDLKPVTN